MYSNELTNYEKTHHDDGEALFGNAKPRWAVDLFKSRYGIELIN